jgi:hypothetical protein
MTRPRLRPYQRDDLHKINDAFERHRRVCYLDQALRELATFKH